VAGAYFDALQRAEQLDAQISDLQGRIDESRQRVTELKRIANDRAVAAYKRSGNSLGSVFLDSSGATDTAHRIKLLDLVNAHDDDAVRVLRRSQDDLTHEHQDLETARAEQASALARLKDQDREVNAKLVAAQTQRQVALDQQIQAQQQAAAEADTAATGTAAPAEHYAPWLRGNARFGQGRAGALFRRVHRRAPRRARAACPAGSGPGDRPGLGRKTGSSRRISPARQTERGRRAGRLPGDADRATGALVRERGRRRRGSRRAGSGARR